MNTMFNLKNNTIPNITFTIFDYCYSGLKPLTVKLIFFSLLLGNLLFTLPNFTPVFAQKKRLVTVTADQPNIWTLEQAHYLLAQMHRRNLDLKARNLGELDVNEVNGINLEIIRTLLGVGVTFNQADKFNNDLVKKDKSFNAERSRKLTQDIDELNNQKLELTKTIARLQREKATTDDEEKKAFLDAQIQENQLIKDEINAQLEVKNAQLSAISNASGTLNPTTSSSEFDKTKFADGTFDEVVAEKLSQYLTSAESTPKLNASLQLDKFVQLQYEIISKQLTLLRDEVGPGERLIFLEMPQSINSTYDKSDDMWAQSRWKISGYTGCMLKINSSTLPCHRILYPLGIEKNNNTIPRSTLDVFRSVTGNNYGQADKINLSIFDIKDGTELAKQFANWSTNKQIENLTRLYFDGLTGNKKKTMQKKFSENGNLWYEYETAKANLQDKQKQCKSATKQRTKCKNELLKLEKLVETAKGKTRPTSDLIQMILEILNNAINSDYQLNSEAAFNRPRPPKRTQLLRQIKSEDAQTRKLLNRLWLEDKFYREIKNMQEADFPSTFNNLDSTSSISGFSKPIENRIVRTIEIIPRQSSLNVNDIQVKNKSSVFNIIFSTLFGLGANANYQRQREQYSQFVQQELYSSGFGKGSREFGWTFTSMPGSKDKILSGTRNTYAIVVVPQDATSIVLESVGCSFDRTSIQPLNFADAVSNNWSTKDKNGCSNDKNFVIPIPGGGFDSNNDFYVSGITYQPVKKGERVNMHIYGNNFSSQIGLLVNGVSLPASIGLAQNFIIDDSDSGKIVAENASKEKVKGTFERVDANQIIATFELENFGEGTPIITLVSPGKAVDLNPLELYINGKRGMRLKKEENESYIKEAEWMFGRRPNKPNFKVDDIQVFVSTLDEVDADKIKKLTALISGKNLRPIDAVYVNGKLLTVSADCKTKNKANEDVNTECFGIIGEHDNNVIQLIFDPPQGKSIHIVLMTGNDVFKLKPITKPTSKPKPADPPALSASIKKMTPFYTDAKKTKLASLLVEIVGTGFDEKVSITPAVGFDIVSPTNAFITIDDPKPAQTITLSKTIDNKEVKKKIVVDLSGIFNPDKPK